MCVCVCVWCVCVWCVFVVCVCDVYVVCVCVCGVRAHVCVCVCANSKTFLLTHNSTQLMVTVNQTRLWISFFYLWTCTLYFAPILTVWCGSIHVPADICARNFVYFFRSELGNRNSKYRYVTLPVKSTTTLALSFKNVRVN